MTIKRGAAWAAAVWLAASACVTFVPRPAPEPECGVAGLELGASVQRAADLFELETPQDAFPAGAPKVYALIRLTDVSAAIRMRWKWYGPDGRLARDTGDVPANTEGLYLEVLTAFDRLDFGPADAAAAPGSWQVAFFLDGRLAARRPFALQADPGKK